MRPISNHRALLITALFGLAAHFCAGQTQAQQKTVSIFIVRHAEVDASQPTIPLTQWAVNERSCWLRRSMA